MVEIIPSIMLVTQVGDEFVNNYDALRLGAIGVAPNHPEKLLAKGMLVSVEVDIVPLQNNAQFIFRIVFARAAGRA